MTITLEQLQKQIKEYTEEYAIIEKFETEVQKLEQEITVLEAENSKKITYDNHKLLFEKKQFLPSVKEQAKEIAKTKVIPLAQKVRNIPVSNYLNAQLDADTILTKERADIINAANELYQRIMAYNESYKQKAHELGENFSQQGYGDLVDKINANSYYNTYATGYLSDQGDFFEGRREKVFSDPSDLSYIMEGR